MYMHSHNLASVQFFAGEQWSVYPLRITHATVEEIVSVLCYWHFLPTVLNINAKLLFNYQIDVICKKANSTFSSETQHYKLSSYLFNGRINNRYLEFQETLIWMKNLIFDKITSLLKRMIIVCSHTERLNILSNQLSEQKKNYVQKQYTYN